MATEIYPRRIVRTGPTSWKGRRRFSCPSAEAQSLENQLYDKPLPGVPAANAPLCDRVERIEGFKSAQSGSTRAPLTLVVAYYGWRHKGTITARTVGRATVRVELWHEYEKLLIDKQSPGRVVEGMDPDGLHVWKITQGSNKVPVPKARIIVEAAFSVLPLSKLAGRVGRVNANVMTKFGSTVGRVGALKFLGSPHTKWWPDAGQWNADFAFEYSGDVIWNLKTKSRKGFYTAISTPVFTVDYGAEATTTKDVVGWRWGKLVPVVSGSKYKIERTKPERRAIYDTASFADINNLIEL